LTIQLANAGPSGTPTVLSRDGCRTVVLVTVGSYPDGYVRLPSGCLPGDAFEVYLDDSANQNGNIFPPTSEDFGDPNLPTVSGVGVLTASNGGKASFIIRKLTSTRWGYIRS
jgi:hypothetical protein